MTWAPSSLPSMKRTRHSIPIAVPSVPQGADALNQQFRDAYVIPEKNNRMAEIRKAGAACTRIRNQAMEGAERLRPYHESLEAVISATN